VYVLNSHYTTLLRKSKKNIKITEDLLPNNDGIIRDESNQTNYQALFSPIRTF